MCAFSLVYCLLGIYTCVMMADGTIRECVCALCGCKYHAARIYTPRVYSMCVYCVKRKRIASRLCRDVQARLWRRCAAF